MNKLKAAHLGLRHRSNQRRIWLCLAIMTACLSAMLLRVFSQDGDGELRLHRLPPPDDDDIDRLLLRVSAKVDKLLFDDDDDGPIDDEAQALLEDRADC